MKYHCHHEINWDRHFMDDPNFLIIKKSDEYTVRLAVREVEKQIEEKWLLSHRNYLWKIIQQSESMEIRIHSYFNQSRVQRYINKIKSCNFLVKNELLSFGEYMICNLTNPSFDIMSVNLIKRLDKIFISCIKEDLIKDSINAYFPPSTLLYSIYPPPVITGKLSATHIIKALSYKGYIAGKYKPIPCPIPTEGKVINPQYNYLYHWEDSCHYIHNIPNYFA